MTDYFQFAAEQIRHVQAELQIDNAMAENLRWSRWIRETAAMIDRAGGCNVLGAVAELFRDREKAAPEGSLAATDWRISAETLEEAAERCDLRNAK